MPKIGIAVIFYLNFQRQKALYCFLAAWNLRYFRALLHTVERYLYANSKLHCYLYFVSEVISSLCSENAINLYSSYNFFYDQNDIGLIIKKTTHEIIDLYPNTFK